QRVKRMKRKGHRFSPSETCAKSITVQLVGQRITTAIGIVAEKAIHGSRSQNFQSLRGREWRRSDGRLVHREMRIDRKNDRYFERVVDVATEEVLHECDEP